MSMRAGGCVGCVQQKRQSIVLLSMIASKLCAGNDVSVASITSTATRRASEVKRRHTGQPRLSNVHAVTHSRANDQHICTCPDAATPQTPSVPSKPTRTKHENTGATTPGGARTRHPVALPVPLDLLRDDHGGEVHVHDVVVPRVVQLAPKFWDDARTSSAGAIVVARTPRRARTHPRCRIRRS